MAIFSPKYSRMWSRGWYLYHLPQRAQWWYRICLTLSWDGGVPAPGCSNGPWKEKYVTSLWILQRVSLKITYPCLWLLDNIWNERVVILRGGSKIQSISGSFRVWFKSTRSKGTNRRTITITEKQFFILSW